MIPFPPNKYDIILADCPWTYRDKAQSGNRGAGFKYPLMTIPEIQALPVQDIAAKDCSLFMWVTFPLLVEGLETIRAWGFKYNTLAFIWIKTNKSLDDAGDIVKKIVNEFVNNPSVDADQLLQFLLFLGMGNWTRSNPELCLFATRGKPKRIDAGVHSVIMSPIRAHSQKPDEQYPRIRRLLGADKRRIELFARTNKVPGWDAWGNEVDKFGE